MTCCNLCIEQTYFIPLHFSGQDYIIPAPANLLVTFEGGSDVTRLVVLIVLVDDDLEEQDMQSFQVRLEIVTSANSALLNLRDEFTGLIQDDEGTWPELTSAC